MSDYGAFSLAVDKIQKTKRFQLLTYAGLLLTYPFALIPTLFKICLGIDEEMFEAMFGESKGTVPYDVELWESKFK